MNAPDYNGPILFALRKGRAAIIVRKNRFKGAEFLDIREHFDGENVEGSRTKIGVTIPIARAGELYGLAKALIAFADEQGSTGLRIVS